MADFALSIKQPWAALLVHGLKTIEVRRWPTKRNGLVYIHAARVPDKRPEGWAQLPPQLSEAAAQRQGIIGAAWLLGCKTYYSAALFAADQGQHLNNPSWFQEPVLYGFTFAEPKVLPFQGCPGWVRFFTLCHEMPLWKPTKAKIYHMGVSRTLDDMEIWSLCCGTS